MTIETNTPFACDLSEVAKLFSRSFERISCTQTRAGSELVDEVAADGERFVFTVSLPPSFDETVEKRHRKRYAKLALYKALKSLTGERLPWGSLTGIRPTAMLRQLAAEEGEENAGRLFRELLDVSEEKASLTEAMVAVQKPYFIRDERTVDLYIGIPFCTTRCSYCSFISSEISRCGGKVEAYLSALKSEIEAAKRMINRLDRKVRCVYVGGGTPTSLSAGQLYDLLSLVNFPVSEFTVEAGRPDTITAEKLDAIARCGCGRISVNPQTLNEDTLKTIGRSHTAEEFFSAFKLARTYPFLINVDLIAGLPGEGQADFKRTLEGVLALCPDNVTVHTLALKKGSVLKEKGYESEVAEVSEMVRLGREEAKACGYLPYYMYRQKYMTGNLENVGYARGDSICRYNIDIMEETTSVIACGANAISKAVFLCGGRIERAANPKDIATYIEKVGQNTQKKEILFNTL